MRTTTSKSFGYGLLAWLALGSLGTSACEVGHAPGVARPPGYVQPAYVPPANGPQPPANGQPPPTQGSPSYVQTQASAANPLALPCQSDATCFGFKCNPETGHCGFPPCQANPECAANFICMGAGGPAAICVPGTP